MKRINNKNRRLFKILTSFALSLILIFTLSLPMISKTINYTSFNALAISVIPSESYTIKFDLPYPPNKKITKAEREKAEKGLSKAFDIPVSSLKPNEHLSTPIVYLIRNAITKTYNGYIRIGNEKSNFSKIKVSFQTKQPNNQSNKSNTNKTIKTLLTAYFTLNNNPLRANIFLIDKGSVLQYASMTIQDKNDNVLAMFRYGKLFKSAVKRRNLIGKADTFYDNSAQPLQLKTCAFSTKSIYINSYLNGYYPYNLSEPAIRTDVLARYPFATQPSLTQYIDMRTWGFQNRIANAFKQYYTYYYGNEWARVGVSYLSNTYKLRYAANDLTNHPLAHDFEYDRFPVSFTLVNSYPLDVSYSIYVPHGRRSVWQQSYNSYGGPDMYNVANYYIQTVSSESSDVFDSSWNNSIQWKDNDYSYSYNENPDSSYKGYFTSVSFSNGSFGSGYYGDFSSSLYYSVMAGSYNNALYDWYYITVSQTFNDVRLDQ